MSEPSPRDPLASANPYEVKRARRGAGAGADDEPTPAVAPSPRQGSARLLRNGLIATFLLVTVTIVPWAVDMAAAASTVHRNTTIDTRAVGTLAPGELDAVVQEAARAWAAVPVTVKTPGGTAELRLGDLGVSLDQPAVRAAALAVGRHDTFPAGLVAWWQSWVSPREVPLSFAGDAGPAGQALAPLERQNHKDPVEASLDASTSGLRLVAATPGTTIDTAEIHRRALDLARAGQRQITIEVGTVALKPRFPASEGQELLDRANKLAERRVSIEVGGRNVTVDSGVIRGWLSSREVPDGSGLEVVVSQEKIEADLPRLIGENGIAPVQLGFAVDPEGKVQIIEGRDGARCCADGSAQRVIDALEAGEQSVSLGVEPVAPDHDRAWAEGLGIREPIGAFTTPHQAGQPRVTNIHLFADTMRGTVIEPGQTLSLNGTVGQRTTEKGYVVDHAIVDGKYEDNVGGGVSQFAATTFNAAFFAGLDIVEYQMHTIAIDRYPFGREATISWEKPDLRIRNNTPFGVLLWPTYTDTSLTVTLYSTPWVKGNQTNQTVTEVKARDKDPETDEVKMCKKVVTERTRTYIGDGHTERDSFVALYQPSEGIRC